MLGYNDRPLIMTVFTCGQASRSMDHNQQCSCLIKLMEAFRGQESMTAYVIEVTKFDSEASCDL